MGKGNVRLGWVAVFVFLLCLISAVPVLAEPQGSPEPAPEASNPPDFDPSKLPDAQGIAEGINEVRAEEAEREQQLTSPLAVEERADSEDAYEDLSPVAAEQLLVNSFEGILAALDADPARYLSEEKLLHPLDQTAATVSGDDGPRLLDSNVPVRARDEEGDLRKVDLSLKVTEEGLEPANPIVPTTIAASADEGVEVGSVAISQLGVDGDSTGRRFDDQNAFFPEVQVSTDLLVSPTSTGVELLSQLRAAESPETLRFDLDLPEGAEVRPSEGGGAEVILASGKPLGRVSPPKAVDAQGTIVPVAMQVEGTTLVLNIEHRGADFAYPILVDPDYYVIEDWIYGSSWFNGHNIGELENPWIWGWYRNTTKITNSTASSNNWVGGSNRGLFTTSSPGNFGANEFGQWAYQVPDWDVYIDLAYIDPFWRTTNGCNANLYPVPMEYDGLWDGSQWLDFKLEEARKYNWSFLDKWGKVLVIGMSSAGGGPDPCYRDLYVGGVGIWMGDWNPPTLGAPTGMPSGWITDGAKFTVYANASDEGLGVKRVTIAPKGTTVIQDQVGQCVGTKAKPCPEFHTSAIEATADDFDEGETASGMVAEDPTGKTSGLHFWTMKVDRTPPKVTLSGQLATLTNEAGSAEIPDGNDKGDRLSFPVYNLTIAAEDGEITADPKTKRSGVKDIEVFLDGNVQPEEAWHQSCPYSSCSMSQTFQLKLAGLSAGSHALRVIARDQVGKVRERKIEFEYFSATGMKDEYVMQHFSLPDGKDHSEEEVSTAPELAVNLMNGNLVYRERDVDIEGPGADLEVERFYNSQLPPEQDTEWGDGWTLAQTPELDLIDIGGSPAADEAALLDDGGAYEGGVELPVAVGGESFDPELQATIEKTTDGYELSDETGETAGTIAFDQSGRTEELQTSGETTVDYSYEDGALSEIAVDDPGSTEASLAEAAAFEEEAIQIEEEAVELEETAGPASYLGSIGSFAEEEEAEKRLEYARDIAIGPEGLWVLDGDPLVQLYGANGDFYGSFGSYGQGPGEFQDPVALATHNGKIWILDRAKNQVMVFDEGGEFLSQFGSAGSGNGKFNDPQGIAVTPAGKIWVADSGNGRLQLFSENGSFLKVAGQGQVGYPTAIDAKSNGEAWVVDTSGSGRIVQVAENGQVVRWAGSQGEGEAKLQSPNGIAVDPQGNVWVAGGCRLKQFGPTGIFLSAFGSCGEGKRQFALASSTGLALDAAGDLWIIDTEHERLQNWGLEAPVIEEAPELDYQDDPAVTLETDDGLISGLEGERAGEHSYEHEGDLLTAHEGPEGETAYEYDGAERMTKVTLPNGTWASIEYNAAYGRVKAVTVDPAGAPAAKTTHFSYSEEPRHTTVAPDDARAVTYDIGPDGSVLKWWNAQQPPDLDDLAGGLYSKKETAKPISTGDHNLVIQAHSEEGIASIEVIANGTTLVDEKHCAQDWEQEGIECVDEYNEWDTNTANWAPGILYLEVIATDRLGMSTSERFWVNIPYTPPTPEGQPDPPTHEEVLKFREEFGLDLDLDPQKDEQELSNRIYDLIGDWYLATTPLGEVARASYERWGVPLRPVDVAELEYREWYGSVNGELIDNWAASNFPEAYAGYLLDHRAGGVLRVGFKSDQAVRLSEIKSTLPVVARDRLASYLVPPSYSRLSLMQSAEVLSDALSSGSQFAQVVTQIEVRELQNDILVGAKDVPLAQSLVAELIGWQSPVTVTQEPDGVLATAGRNRITGRMRAGDRIFNPADGGCTAGFGAYEDVDKPNNERVRRRFLLSAAHCFDMNDPIFRSEDPNSEGDWSFVGIVTRNALSTLYGADGLAIRDKMGDLVPYGIFGSGGNLVGVHASTKAQNGNFVCYSGQRLSGVSCGHVVGRGVSLFEGSFTAFYKVKFLHPPRDGDSGAPVWNPVSSTAVGLVTGNFVKDGTVAAVTPLEHPDRLSWKEAPGLLNQPAMDSLELNTSD